MPSSVKFRRSRGGVTPLTFGTPQYIILHHADNPHEGDQLSVVNGSHKKRGFPVGKLGYYVVYHYFIERSGQVIQTREESERSLDWGATANAQANFQSLSIALAGDFRSEHPTRNQIKSLEKLTLELQKKYSIPDTNVLNHRDTSPTDCPHIDLAGILKPRSKDNRVSLLAWMK